MTTASREAIASGDTFAFLDTLGPDQFERVDVEVPGLGSVHAAFARVGRTVIGVRSNGDMMTEVHETDDLAVACFARTVEGIRAQLAALQAAMAADGAAGLLGALQSLMGEGEATVPIPTAPPAVGRAAVPAVPAVRYVSDDGPTGMYL